MWTVRNGVLGIFFFKTLCTFVFGRQRTVTGVVRHLPGRRLNARGSSGMGPNAGRGKPSTDDWCDDGETNARYGGGGPADATRRGGETVGNVRVGPDGPAATA